MIVATVDGALSPGESLRLARLCSALGVVGTSLNDVLAAATVGWLVGASATAMTTAVDGFRGLEHAMELAGESAGVRFAQVEPGGGHLDA